MFERFRTSRAPAEDEATTVAKHEDEATTVAEPEDDATTVAEPVDERFMRAVPAGEEAEWQAVRERRTVGPVVDPDTLAAMRARQRDRFGGISWGGAFFGLLSAVGLASLLLGIVVAAGVAIGVSEVKDTAEGTNDTIGIGGAVALLAVLAIAWLCGGYVAGRMARFDGGAQGFGVWAWTLFAGALVAVLAAIGGDDYNVFHQLNLPNVAVGGASLTTGGVIVLICAIAVTLVGAAMGGIAGERFHRRVDRVAAHDYTEFR